MTFLAVPAKLLAHSLDVKAGGALLLQLQSKFANPFPPYSLQKRPKPQICPKFVPAIVLGGSSQGGAEIWKKLPKFVRFQTILTIFSRFQPSLTGTAQNNRWDKFWTNLGFRAFLKAVRGKRVRKSKFIPIR